MSIGTLIAFIVVCIGVLVLRYTRPDLPRPFRVKWVWFTVAMGVVFCAGMAASLPAGTWLRLVMWSASAFAIYFALRLSSTAGCARADRTRRLRAPQRRSRR